MNKGMFSTAQRAIRLTTATKTCWATQCAPTASGQVQRVLVVQQNHHHQYHSCNTEMTNKKPDDRGTARRDYATTVASGNRWKQHAGILGTTIYRRDICQTKRSMSASAALPKLVAVEEARRFMVDCFVKSNTPLAHAQQMADLLVEADYRGHFSHGMNRLEMYINDLHKNCCNGAAVPKILCETGATAWVDGNNGLGAVVGNFCMDLAIKKAGDCGIGWVCAKRSNHYGIAGWYALRAMKANYIGISMTNTSPLASPTRSKEAALGTNPIAVGAPAKNGDGFVLDMATTAVAVGKIEIQRRKGEPIPVGWAQDPTGHPTTDANVAFDTACLMPLGGTELTSGYKGYGLSAMVEMFCGIMAGSNYATNIRKWTHAGSDSEANLGQCFVAVNPTCFAPGFEARLSDLNGILRNMPRTDESKPVLVAGDPERNHMKKVDKDGGLAYHENQIKTCNQLSERLGVPPITFL
ncbi:uncharacterized oxidoreductase YjmC [Toxorhynchites rutilus septentrionalis]|uniref:uncharacterized oxidoreductase YjmC n=1 Tax=Toxorhynchites rutilus septentrionalis TaxID=329112 RepID=UPI00247932B6|nr:uncharacterized oxidoreductase YjmC [Toxorhynchites rutilus septentrionalis]XP_055625035.1 uncharacterized oxidoreductase YjmC [Toxorhynchites rutilus septentrionalis]XP_055625036.1 uncharacterized oxidoreductase YjmC [Toxorhynchites rutilus septentrionalis]XP_055625037.1 uncharacterized oxidoreductase YjmC [Toxorhynchites rutilus septentrionalis]